jgi:outer membrane immunogenic protein
MFLRRAFLACAMPALMLVSSVSAMADNFDNAVPYDTAGAKWSGVYLGLHAGYGWDDINSDYDFGGLNNVLFNDVGLKSGIDNSLEGYIVGGQIGFQHQIGRWVVGVEGTASATGIDGSSKADWAFNDIGCVFFACFGAAGQGSQSLQVKLDHLYTVTGKLGYTHDNWLAYVKGGYATADIDVTSNIGGDVTLCFVGCLTAPVSSSGDSDKRHDGWVVGGGIEKMIYPNLTLGVEYNYIDLSSRTHSVDAPLNIGFAQVPGGFKVRVDPDAIQTVTLRLNFLLNAPTYAEAAPLK